MRKFARSANAVFYRHKKLLKNNNGKVNLEPLGIFVFLLLMLDITLGIFK